MDLEENTDRRAPEKLSSASRMRPMPLQTAAYSVQFRFAYCFKLLIYARGSPRLRKFVLMILSLDNRTRLLVPRYKNLHLVTVTRTMRERLTFWPIS